jgi:hypothetical protein
MFLAPGLSDHPGPVLPRGIVAHMLIVATLKPGDPVTILVNMETHDLLFHRQCHPFTASVITR